MWQNAEGRWEVEWDDESLLSLHSPEINMRVTRVGFVRYAEGIKPEEEDELTKALQPFSCVPVFLDEELANKFYRDFCKVGERVDNVVLSIVTTRVLNHFASDVVHRSLKYEASAGCVLFSSTIDLFYCFQCCM